MTFLRKTVATSILVIFLSAALMPAVSRGLTVAEEEQLAREYIKILRARMDIIDDPLIVGYINSLGQKLVNTFPRSPFNYKFYVVKQEVYNAFAIPGGHIFMYTGLMAAMENEGITVDRTVLARLSGEFAAIMAAREEEIYTL